MIEAFRPERGGEREEGENSNTPDPKGPVDDGKSWYSEGSCIRVFVFDKT